MAETATTVIVSLFLSILLFFSILYLTPFSLFFNHNTEDQDDILSTINDQVIVDQRSLVKPLPDSTFDEKDVVVLTDMNFSDFIARNQYVLVDFYAPWCHWSQRLAPEYAATATLMKIKFKSINATLAKVDCDRETLSCRRLRIQGYPTLSLFINGVGRVHYYGERTRDGIANWVDQKINNNVQNLTTVEEAQSISAENSVLVLGFLDSLEGPETVELAAVTKLHFDVSFYQTTNADVARFFHIDEQIKPPALVMLKRKDNAQFAHEGQFTRSEIDDFVSTYKLPSVITFTAEGASNIFENPMKQLWLFASDYSAYEVVSIFKEAANAFRGKLLFVQVDIGDGYEASYGANIAYKFGVHISENASRVVAYYRTSGGTKKHMYHGELSFSGIKSFAEEFLAGKFDEKSDPAIKTVLRLPLHTHTSDPSSIPHSY